MSCNYTIERVPISLGTPVHSFLIRDSVWVKDWKKDPLKPQWTGPHTVILTTLTALQVSGVALWAHHSQVRKAHHPDEDKRWWKAQPDHEHPLCLHTQPELSD